MTEYRYLTKHLAAYAEKRLTHSEKGSKKQYVCPFCGSGTGEKKTGAFTVYETDDRFFCFKCRKGGDIFDLVRKVEGLNTEKEAAEWLTKNFLSEAEPEQNKLCDYLKN